MGLSPDGLGLRGSAVGSSPHTGIERIAPAFDLLHRIEMVGEALGILLVALELLDAGLEGCLLGGRGAVLGVGDIGQSKAMAMMSLWVISR